MLARRLLSAAVLVPVVGAAVWFGGVWLAAMVMAAALLAGWEYYRLLRKGGYTPSVPLGLLFIAVLLAGAYWPEWRLIPPALTGMLMLSLSWQLFQAASRAPMVDWALTVSGGLYLGWMAGHFIALRAEVYGLRWLTVALVATWICDTGAFLLGRSFGKHRLWPRISPGKTWEGAVGGWLCGVAVSAAAAGLLDLGWLHGALAGALVGVAAPLGDLSVSMLKRQVGVKDSSGLIPGHGGVLDRIDSLLFTVPVVYHYVRFLVGF